MKVFLSWSGELSHKLALELRDWLPFVIQSVEPYVSSEDIDKGTRWSIDIAKELENSSFGVLCVTPQNLDAPWINFEAGALSKAFNTASVSPFLFGLKPSDLKKSPLLQFQSTLYDKKDFLKLIYSINNSLGKEKLDEKKLERTFEMWWENLKSKLDLLLPDTKKNEKKDSESPGEVTNSEILEELLELTRNQYKILRNPESLLPPSYLGFIFKNMGFIEPEGRVIRDLDRAATQLKAIVENTTPEQPINIEDLKFILHKLQRPIAYLHEMAIRSRHGLISNDLLGK
jgi:hypothetical protein